MGVDVVVEASKIQSGKGSEDCDWRSQQHAKWKSPTVILRGHNEKDHEQRQTEDHDRTDALRCCHLLVGHARIVIAHLHRHRLRKDILESCDGLTRAVTRRRGAIDLDRLKLIEPHHKLWAAATIDRGESAQWNHLIIGI